MKKLLSLLSMLMITVMAFATDYTDALHFEVNLLGSKTVDLPSGTLSIDKRVDGTYTVTAKGCDFSAYEMGNWYEIVCDEVAGTTDANGVTTINVDNPYSFRTSDNTTFSNTKLVVKFNDTKAYAHFEGNISIMYVARAFEYTFGTDEGFESTGGSTGGGETGGETSSIVTIKENFQNNGVKFKEPFTIDWDKQKVVMSIDPTSCGNDLEHIIGLGVNCDQWDNALHVYNKYFGVYPGDGQTYNRKMLQAYFPAPGNNNNTGVMDRKTPFSIEVSKDKGFVLDGEVKIAASQMTALFNNKELTVGSGQGGDPASNALYKYIKVVPLGWKEPVTPPSVKETKTFNEALYMGGTKAADAKVVVKEMSDNTVNMSLQFSGYEYTSTELTKGTDSKNRTTYTGKVAKDEQTYDVKAVVYKKDNVERLYMTMTTSVTTVVVGENPDAVTPDPEVKEVSNKTYTSNLKLTDAESEEDVVDMAKADVNIIKYSDESYKITLKKVALRADENDLVFVGKALEETTTAEAAADLYISAKPNTATKGILGDVTATFAISEVSEDEIKMGIAIEGESVLYEGEFNYTDEEVEEPEVYTSNLHIYDTTAPETDLFQADQAKVEFLATATGGFKLTLKDVTLNENTQDLVFTGALPAPQPGGQEELAEEGEGEVTPAEPAMVLNATADEATATFLGATSATAVFNVIMNDEAETENDAFALTFTITAGEKTLGGEFNYEKKDPDTPVEPTFPMENYQADGKGFVVSTDIDWSKQKFQAIIDATKCNAANTEDIFGFGEEATAWFKNIHVYADKGSYKAYFQYADGEGNNNTTLTIADQSNITIEVSKAEGLTVDGVVVIAAEKLTGIFDLTTVKFGSGENSQYSNALYKSVKLVDLNPETGINAINAEVANGEAQLFTVNGVKLNKLQKGLNIVRTADGKVKKVLVK